jgi:serine protease Do
MKKLILAVLAVLLGWNGWLTYTLLEENEPEGEAPETVNGTTYINHTVNSYATDVTAIASGAQPGLVSVTSYLETERVRTITGIIYESANDHCDILTNARILEDDVSVTVRFDNGIELDAIVLGSDSRSDIALLRTYPEFIAEPMKFTDSDKVNQGEYMVAVGSRRADTQHNTVSFGVVSQPGYMNRPGDETTPPWILSVIESDASINLTNTGGPLLNLSGEIAAVLSQTLTTAASTTGMSYGVTANEIQLIVKDIYESGYATRAYLGVIGIDVADMELYQKSALNLSLDQITGVYIHYVAPDSPAEAAGVAVGDILTGIGEHEISNRADLMRTLYDMNPEDSTTLTIIHGQNTVELPAVMR